MIALILEVCHSIDKIIIFTVVVLVLLTFVLIKCKLLIFCKTWCHQSVAIRISLAATTVWENICVLSIIIWRITLMLEFLALRLCIKQAFGTTINEAIVHVRVLFDWEKVLAHVCSILGFKIVLIIILVLCINETSWYVVIIIDRNGNTLFTHHIKFIILIVFCLLEVSW